MLRVVSLCTGYGGFDLAVEAVLGDVELVAVSDIEPGPCALLERRFPEAVNLGDLKVFDWSTLGRVDVILAGYPCQPFSHAGQRKGTDDPRHLWPFIADAVRVLRPRLVLLENVAGHLGLGFDVVLADLAALGFDAEWALVRASDVGACHGRARLFVVAADASRRGDEDEPGGGVAAGQPLGAVARAGGRAGGRDDAPGVHRGRRPARLVGGVADADGSGLEGRRAVCGGGGQRPVGPDGVGPHADADVASRGPRHAEPGDGAAAPRGRGPSEPGGRGSPAADACRERHGRGEDARSVGRVDGAAEGEAPERERARPVAGDRGAEVATDADVVGLQGVDVPGVGEGLGEPGDEPPRGDPAATWGRYAPAIARHAAVVGRPAPNPTDGRGALSPRFVEWMMMLPEGWVTDLPDLSRAQALRLLGNGVVPPQAAAALVMLLGRIGWPVAVPA